MHHSAGYKNNLQTQICFCTQRKSWSCRIGSRFQIQIGTALLATASCLKTGARLTTLVSEEWALQAARIALPEVMTSSELLFEDQKKYTYAARPVMGTDFESTDLLAKMIKQSNEDMVLDADAITIISNYKDLLNQLPPHSILTPHPKEFDRLFGSAKMISIGLKKLYPYP